MNEQLAAAGFDVVHAFDTAVVARESGLEMFADPTRRLGILVGNTRALWPAFLAARRADPELAAASDPIDRYAERVIARAFAGERVWFGHVTYERGYVPMQRLAAAAGLAYIAPTQLAIHPIYGPWFGLRAVLALAGEPPPTAPIAAPCTCGDACLAAFRRAREHVADLRPWIAVREACPLGREHRYSDDQLAYHYTKDLGLLR